MGTVKNWLNNIYQPAAFLPGHAKEKNQTLV